MESSNTELNRTSSSPLKHEHETPAPLATNLNTHHQKNYSLSSSIDSSPPDSPSHDHAILNNDDDDRDDNDDSSSASSPETPVLENSVPQSDHDSPPCVANPTPSTTSLTSNNSSPFSSEPATEAPHNQEMARAPSAYRIPSSVFERSKSSTPMEWSVASNESLFSIHMGNMSFTNDHFCWRSGELGPPAEASTSDQMFSYSAQESAGRLAADMRSRELGIAEATMLEVIKESESDGRSHEKTLAEVRKARRSEESNTSNKSFAFSIMGGDTGSTVRIPSSVRSNQEQSQSHSQPMAKPKSPPDPKSPAEIGNGAQSRWFSCFSCCSFCQ